MNLVRELEQHKMDITEVRRFLPPDSKAMLYKSLTGQADPFGSNRCAGS